MRYQHTKLFEEWLLERDLSSPIFIEMEAGNIKVYADPQQEDWRGESARAEMYEEKREKLDHAVKNDDDEENNDDELRADAVDNFLALIEKPKLPDVLSQVLLISVFLFI